MANNKKGSEISEEAVVEARKPRKKVYERLPESELPEELVKVFKKQGYDLKLIRWSLLGEEDYKYLTQREKEGYEFVSESELPDWYKNTVRLIDTKGRAGMVILGDLCLMKIDSDLRQSRVDFYKDETSRQLAAVDVHVLEKKGFRNLGTKSKVMLKEPSFQE